MTMSGPDLVYLQDFYEQINDTKIASFRCDCPTCGQAIEVDAASPRDGVRYRVERNAREHVLV